jgi:hypothetical protein
VERERRGRGRVWNIGIWSGGVVECGVVEWWSVAFGMTPVLMMTLAVPFPRV